MAQIHPSSLVDPQAKLADFRGRSVLPRRIPQPHGRAHARG